MSWIMCDIEADGPIPGDYSMIALGAIVVEPSLEKTFEGKIRAISTRYVPEALAVSGFTREQTLNFFDPTIEMERFEEWIGRVSVGRPMFISDNNGFDAMFVSYYFWHFLGRNPFGHSSTNLGSLYKGMRNDVFKNFKHLRKTRHSHDPLDDARGNAEALLAMKLMGLVINLE
jgi:DNA polymerase III epsilon subunit-like protein